MEALRLPSHCSDLFLLYRLRPVDGFQANERTDSKEKVRARCMQRVAVFIWVKTGGPDRSRPPRRRCAAPSPLV